MKLQLGKRKVFVDKWEVIRAELMKYLDNY